MPFDENQDALIELGYLVAEASRNLVFVLGAGLSRSAGIPGWQGLCDGLVAELRTHLHGQGVGSDEIEQQVASLLTIKDLWILGDELRKALPQERYEDCVRALLTGDHVPPTYDAIWKLAPSGAISFNLDSLASDSLSGRSDQIASPFESGTFQRFLLLQRAFLLQPHGRLEQPKTWVLGAEARNRLLRDAAYRRFINAVITSRRLVIVGFGPRDIAFEALLLDDFRQDLADSPPHFWITPRLSAESRAWASQYRLLPIEYEPADNSHSEVFDILAHLGTFEPRSDSAPIAFHGEAIAVSELPPEETLRTDPPESIRRKLNAALRGLSAAATTREAFDSGLNALLEGYSGSIHMAWHVRPPQYSRLWGYKLAHLLGEGAFGHVWRARDPIDNSECALKLLREEVLSNAAMYEAFRRGVNALRLLGEAHVDGIVKFISAFDIPACVVMECVEGVTLSAALEQRHPVDRVDTALRVVGRVAEVVNSAHQLRTRVFHRDLKPSNVMIRHSHALDLKRDVTVLDFDLSWYDGAWGQSTLPGGRIHNYFAPEQIAPHRMYSSRHAAVDVFGLGMLLYFVATGTEPELNVQRTADFKRKMVESMSSRWRWTFAASKLYLADFVRQATVDEQPLRISVPNLIEAIRTVADAEASGYINVPSDLAVIQIGQGVVGSGIWTASRDGLVDGAFSANSTVSGARIDIAPASGTESGIFVSLTYDSEGAVRRSNVGRYLADRINRAGARLRQNGLFQEVRTINASGSGSITGIAHGARWDLQKFGLITDAVVEAAATLAFEDRT